MCSNLYKVIKLAVFANFLLASLFCLPSVTFAQTPSTVEPGKIDQRFRPKIEPRTAPEEIIKPMDDEMSEDDGGVTFLLNDIIVTGNTVYSQEALRENYSEFIGTDVSFGTLNKIANNITNFYREEGYILARAYIPPQKVNEGQVEVRIVEGYIDQVLIEGEVAGTRKLLNAFAEKIKASNPLTSETLERYMLLMDDLPGVTARGLLRPAANAVGAADLVVALEHELVEFIYEINNRGTKFLGPVQFSALMNANSWFGQYDRTMLRAVTTNQTKELKFLDALHSQPIGSEGAQISLSFTRTISEPGSTLKSSSLDSENASGDIQLSYPIIRSRNKNLFVRSGFGVRETDTTAGGEPLTKDQVRTAYLGTQFDIVDPIDGINLVDLEVVQGLDIWNATNADAGASRTNAQAAFTKGVLNLSRYQPLPDGFGILVSAIGQYSNEALLASEEIGIGGSDFGRAYDPSEITGDHGAAGIFEFQYNKFMGLDYLSSFQAYAFYDGGAVWNRNAETGESSRATLASTGAGIRYNFTDVLSGYTEVSFPLTRKVASEGVEDEHDPRFFVSIVRRF